jgi:hypothetical protein
MDVPVVVPALEAKQTGEAEQAKKAPVEVVIVVALLVAPGGAVGQFRFLGSDGAELVGFLLQFLRLLGHGIGLLRDGILRGCCHRGRDQHRRDARPRCGG